MKTEWQTCLWCITREISPVEFVIKCHSLLLCPLRLEKNRVIGHENGSASLILMAPFINQANHTRDTYKADFTLSFIFRRHRTLKRRIRFRDKTISKQQYSPFRWHIRKASIAWLCLVNIMAIRHKSREIRLHWVVFIKSNKPKKEGRLHRLVENFLHFFYNCPTINSVARAKYFAISQAHKERFLFTHTFEIVLVEDKSPEKCMNSLPKVSGCNPRTAISTTND